jgi:hypothetical protein
MLLFAVGMKTPAASCVQRLDRAAWLRPAAARWNKDDLPTISTQSRGLRTIPPQHHSFPAPVTAHAMAVDTET